MPTVKPLSDFTRNQSALLQELHDTGEPIYLTRNGTSAVVVMDAEAFDREMSLRTSAFKNEMRIYDSLMEGYSDYLEGRTIPAAEAEKRILKAKGWE